MKKKSLPLLCIALAVMLVAMLCGCSAYGGIHSAYEKAGYEEVELSDEIKSLLENSKDYQNISEVIKLHVLQKKSASEGLGNLFDDFDVVVIAEFNSNETMEEALKSHITAQDAENIYEELQKLDYVSGNCFLLLATTQAGETVFKDTK